MEFLLNGVLFLLLDELLRDFIVVNGKGLGGLGFEEKMLSVLEVEESGDMGESKEEISDWFAESEEVS